mmetsp:Transcript_8326/g.23341  ORF Transcript_8326/g.23341 Transcript_8326/m.23341 type:complete len:315 (+) Transcript_8326:2-946(+)
MLRLTLLWPPSSSVAAGAVMPHPLSGEAASQEEIRPGREHRHVGKGQGNQWDGEEGQVVHEHEVVQPHLREERVHEERGHERDAVERQLREQVLEAGHGHERQDQVENDCEHRGSRSPGGVLEDHLVHEREQPHHWRQYEGHGQRLPWHHQQREAYLGEAGAERGHRHRRGGACRSVGSQAPVGQGPDASKGGHLRGGHRGGRRGGHVRHGGGGARLLHRGHERAPLRHVGNPRVKGGEGGAAELRLPRCLAAQQQRWRFTHSQQRSRRCKGCSCRAGQAGAERAERHVAREGGPKRCDRPRSRAASRRALGPP